MRVRISYVLSNLRDSYWFVPALMTAGAVLLSALTLWADGLVDAEQQPAWLQTIVYSGESDGARELLGTVASSMITVAGVVFSITLVALTLASSQFGPRMLVNFMRDRGNQITLGTFIATFLYSLLILRKVRSATDEEIPHLSVTVDLVLAIASLVVLIYFIHHISVTIQAPSLIASIGHEIKQRTDHLFPDVEQVANARAGDPVDLPEDDGRVVDSPSSGYVEVLDLEGLVTLATEHDLLIRLDSTPGQYVVRGTALATAWPADAVTDDVAGTISGTVVTGFRRTDIQDIEFPIRQLVEIAVRALSPAINDPFTAVNCVDQLSAALCDFAARELPTGALADEDGRTRLVVAEPVTFERLLGSAYDQIRQAAGYHSAVYTQLLEALGRVAACVRSRDWLEEIERCADLVLAVSQEEVAAQPDRDRVRRRYDAFRRVADQVRRDRFATQPDVVGG